MNKKIIKTFASITCGLGIVSSISLMTTTSCTKHSDESLPPIPTNYTPLPTKVFNVDESGTLKFVDNFKIEDYKNCDTLEIPSELDGKTINDVYISYQTKELLGIKNIIIPKEIKKISVYCLTWTWGETDSTIESIILYGNPFLQGNFEWFTNLRNICYVGLAKFPEFDKTSEKTNFYAVGSSTTKSKKVWSLESDNISSQELLEYFKENFNKNLYDSDADKTGFIGWTPGV